MNSQDKTKIQYYLFELGNTVVKMENDLFYERDQKNHEWIQDGEWMRRFYDGGYGVIEIDYDEETEQISNMRAIKGSWSSWQDEMLANGGR